MCLCWLCPAKVHKQNHGVASLTERISFVTIRILKYVNDGKSRVLVDNQGMSVVAYTAKYVAAQARRGDVSAMEHDK